MRKAEILPLCNIRFFKDGELIQHSYPALEFADCISLTFEHQTCKENNGAVTQQASEDSVISPVQFTARIVRKICSYPDTNLNTKISTYYTDGTAKNVTSAQVINALRDAVNAIGETRLGISKKKWEPIPSNPAPQWPCTLANAQST